MASQWKSVLGGAAVATLLMLPAAADNTNWTIGQWKGFDANSVKVDGLVGKLRIDVKPQNKISLQVSGTRNRVGDLKIYTSGGQLVISGSNRNAVWDWKNWFDFSDSHNSTNDLDVHVVVPKGTDVDVKDMVGNAAIGDTGGRLGFEAVASESTIGNVSQAHVSMEGSGKISLAKVDGELNLDIAGSGKVKAISVGSAKVDLAGSGAAELGAIGGGLHLDIAGSGDFSATRVNGPVHVDIVGAGSVNIAQGEANPLHIDIMGSGNFAFGGEAVDPHVSAMGSGNVKIKSYRGKLSTDGMADVKIGD